MRFWLEDENKRGMQIVVYDPDNKEYVKGHTLSSNNYRVLLETKPTKEGTCTIKIVSDDGSGGWDYGFNSAVRAY
ncbi:hypothetical protein J27TS7_11300 [Paenibacillus dendritiformis]|nr:hypothetical protein J27TS7_11300 [Paenibacillus dendritiformis]